MRLRLFVILVLIGLIGRRASAQFYGSIADPALPLLPDKILAELDRNGLDLSEVEQEIIKSVLGACQSNLDLLMVQRAEIERQRREIILELSSAGRSQDGLDQNEQLNARLRGLGRRELDVNTQIHSLKNTALSDVRDLLPPDKQVVWDRILRDRRREQTIGRNSRFIAEGVDLVALVEQLERRSEEVGRLVEQYAIDLDPVLIERNEIILKSLQEYYKELYSDDEGDLDPQVQKLLENAETFEESRRINAKLREAEAMSRIERIRRDMQLHLQVREMNRSYYDRISSCLGAGDAAIFRNAFQSAAYASYPVFFKLPADRVFESLIVDPRIDDKMRTAIVQIRDEDYVLRRDELNQALAEAYDRWELRWEDRILGTLDPSYENRIRTLHEFRRSLQERVISDVLLLVPKDLVDSEIRPGSIKDEPQF